jgi:hypothetical protein
MNHPIEVAKLELKHQLAIDYSIELCSTLGPHAQDVVRTSFDLAEAMVDRMAYEFNALKAREAQEEDEFDPVQHFMDSVMDSIAKQRGRAQQ